ncbi:MAG: polysaccharide deacetylase family protein [Coriobacteriales bacterium]|nr:polysaccharide deacetylase family protein [Coriobacteriales bacterium]
MRQTATPRDTAKHPLKPNRRPPRTQRQRWYLVMSTSILAAIVVLGALLYWINRPVSITVNGKQTHVRIGSTATEVFEDKHVQTTPGDVVSVNDRVLRAGEGHAFSLKVNDQELSPQDGEAYCVQGDEQLEFSDGANVVEDYETTTEPILPELAFYGTGTTVSYISQWGRSGTLEHRTGKESGEQTQVVAEEPVPCIVTRTDLLLDEDHPYVALTFDDGPADPYTEQYLDILAEHGARATFFCLGDSVEQYPELAQRVVGAGHQLANHTMAHNQLTSVPDATVRDEIERSAAVIEGACGVATTHLRPPYGDFTERSWLASGGTITAAVRWSGDSQDWRLPGADAIVENLLAGVRPGSILLMHDGGGDRSQDVEALPKVIERLQEDGYELVTVSELLRAAGDIPEEVCSGTGTMPEGAVWPEQIAPDGYLDTYLEQHQ